MNARRIAWSRTLGAVAAVLTGASAAPARAQFVPGHIFGLHHSNNFCKDDGKTGTPIDSEYIYDINPETGEYRIFATIPREWCGVITGMAFSPDGKRLRVASMLLSLIWEFDAQGNRTIALDWTDGIVSPEGCNCIAYDQRGNFYVSSKGPEKVLRFPADGGPRAVLAYENNNGLLIGSPHSLAVGPGGEVYLADYVSDHLIRISPGGEVSVFDKYTFNQSLYSLTVADNGEVYALVLPPGIYRYAAGQPFGRETFTECDSQLCVYLLTPSPDRRRIYATSSPPFYSIVSIDPADASFELVAVGPIALSLCGLAGVPLRGDVDGDADTDLTDLQSLLYCMLGVNVGPPNPECGLADMDGDGDVDLFDVRYFMLGYTAFGKP
jgi:WD40 repeat protein